MLDIKVTGDDAEINVEGEVGEIISDLAKAVFATVMKMSESINCEARGLFEIFGELMDELRRKEEEGEL